MKKSLFMIAFLIILISNRSYSIEIDTVWVSSYYNKLQFLHPISKNILLTNGLKLQELNVKDGKLIKEIDFGHENKLDLSPDGNKLLSVTDNNSYIFEYPSINFLEKFDSCINTRFINNNEIVFNQVENNNLTKYNLITKEKQVYINDELIQDITISKDGRLIAISTKFIDVWQYEWKKLILIDTKTMTKIVILEEIMNIEGDYLDLNFSLDGKYLAYNSYIFNDNFQRNIYNTETFQKVKNYNNSNILSQFLGITFLNNNYYILSEGNYINNYLIFNMKIIDINSDKILFSLDNFDGALFDNENNHLYYKDSKSFKLICLNLNKLITGVSSTQVMTIVNYQNKQLIINKENVKRVEIFDISGRLVTDKIIENPFFNNTLIPIELINGHYLINITTDKDNFTHKLIVME